jgi:hypothetical protein
MKEKPKSRAELERELPALKARAEAAAAAARALLAESKADTRNSVRIWAVLLFIAVGAVMNALQVRQNQRSWRASFNWHEWRSLFWCDLLAVGLLAFFWGLRRVETGKRKQKAKAKADWYRNLEAVADVKDYQDWDYLYHDLEPEERERLLGQLRRMPRGSRSLHRAVEVVKPELIDDEV